jgi:hypothetical protein
MIIQKRNITITHAGISLQLKVKKMINDTVFLLLNVAVILLGAGVILLWWQFIKLLKVVEHLAFWETKNG